MTPSERQREEHSTDDCAHLKEFLLCLIAEHDARYNLRMDLSDKAAEEAKQMLGVRLHALNEFRGQMADQQATFARKDEVQIRFDGLEKKLEIAITTLATTQGKSSGAAAVWAILVVVLSLIVSAAGVVVSILIKH